MGASQPEIALLLRILDQAFDKKSWHGTNLRGSVRGLAAEEASWRPGPNRKSIADHVVHAAYWKYTVRRRLLGEKRGSFPIKGSNWFALADPLSEESWRGYVALLDSEHRALRAAIADLPADQLDYSPPGSTTTNFMLISGIAAHDLYHCGQIQLLKRLQGEEEKGVEER